MAQVRVSSLVFVNATSHSRQLYSISLREFTSSEVDVLHFTRSRYSNELYEAIMSILEIQPIMIVQIQIVIVDLRFQVEDRLVDLSVVI